MSTLDRCTDRVEGLEHPAARDVRDLRLEQHAVAGAIVAAPNQHPRTVSPSLDEWIHRSPGIGRSAGIYRLQIGRLHERGLHQTADHPVRGHGAEVIEVRSPGAVLERRCGYALGHKLGGPGVREGPADHAESPPP